MCGISGFAAPRSSDGADRLAELALLMAGALAHRGPDAEGAWVDAEVGIALSHRRLAVIDLSPEAGQPMCSADGRWVLTYNGEIYNYRELRRRLEQEGVRFRTSSDTEVLLEGCASWGVLGTLRRLDGMFAFALWDRQSRRLTLGRDRLGEKPLCYGWQGERFFFASETKALAAHPDFHARLDLESVAQFVRHGHVPAPWCVLAGISKLRPGCLVEIDPAIPGGMGEMRPYWSVGEALRDALANPFRGSAQDAEDELDRIMSEAVQSRTVADVPVGAFLSGGIDSSLVVALLQEAGGPPARTFTIGMPGRGYDESADAREVADHLGTDHTEVIITPNEALDLVPSLASTYDEPFADSSQLPTLLLSRIARRDVTVALSGDGGDELFGGYDRYRTHSLWRRAERLPFVLRHLAADALQRVPSRGWDALLRAGGPFVPSHLRYRRVGEKVHKIAPLLRARDPWSAYEQLMWQWERPGMLLRDAPLVPSPINWARGQLPEAMPVQSLGAIDLLTYLPDDILVKVDRASMSVGLEVRVPLLAPAVTAFALGLPDNLRVVQGRGKWLLRRVLARRVPEQLFERPKMGFGVPLGEWLRGPLKPWAQSLLADRPSGELLDDVTVQRIWSEHQDGARDWQHQLWSVLMLEDWLRQHQLGP